MRSPRNPRRYLVVALVAGLSIASAGPGHGAETATDGWAPVKHLEFTADDVEGGLLGPEGERIEAVPRAEHPSLIELREGFEAEVVKTLEDL